MSVPGIARLGLAAALLGSALCGAVAPASAHDVQKNAAGAKGAPAADLPAANLPAKTPAQVEEALFGGRVGRDFDLVDQTGARKRLADFGGRNVLLFFGYANCEAICSAAIPAMAAALDALPTGHPKVELVMITVDPARDTPEGLGQGLKKYDARVIGLTGPRERLEAAWKAFGIDVSEVARDWEDRPIYAHGSFVYLLGKDGKVKTLLPPILSPEQMAKIIGTYL